MGSKALVEFRSDDRAEILAQLVMLERERDGWANIEPVVDDDVEIDAPPTQFGAWFTARGPVLPFATFMPGARTRRGTKPTSIGLEHGTGTKARDRLIELGIVIPDGWQKRQDHPKRGLVFELPESTEPVIVLDFLLRAATAFCPVALDGRWSALITRK